MAPEVRGLGIAIMELGVAELAAGRLAWAMLEELVIITWTRPGMVSFSPSTRREVCTDV